MGVEHRAFCQLRWPATVPSLYTLISQHRTVEESAPFDFGGGHCPANAAPFILVLFDSLPPRGWTRSRHCSPMRVRLLPCFVHYDQRPTQMVMSDSMEQWVASRWPSGMR
ncbi:hypothetical protein PM082_011315 [Marasmius tenuissimus]|nr:hypothetical protein PM082_011315 [Marasmius tenuissimus]